MRKIIGLCVLNIALSASAEVYRWVDGAGKAHYGDRPPQGARGQTTQLEIKTTPATIDAEAEKARQQLRVIEEGRRREQAFAAQRNEETQQQRADLAQRCQSLQNDIRDDRNTAIFYRYDDAGKRVHWTHEERLAYREKLHSLKQTYCPDLPD